MPKKEAPLPTLQKFLPNGAFEPVMAYLHQHRVHLTITRARESVLGDYRNASGGQNHRISVNGNLNAYAFLITLLHELAHLVAFQEYGNRISHHGKEWKHVYQLILSQFIHTGIFPIDIEQAIQKSLHGLAASSCADDDLMRALRKYDVPKKDFFLVEEIAQGRCFITRGGKVFRREERIRKRYKCIELATGKVYLFSPVFEVKAIQE